MSYVSHHSCLDEEMGYVCWQLQQEIQHGKPDEVESPDECNEEEIYLPYILSGELLFIFVEHHPSYSSVIFPNISNYFSCGKSTHFPLRSMQKVT